MRQRKSPRLAGYNYALPGAYFVTINNKNSGMWFGEVIGIDLMTNRYGSIASACWSSITEHYPNVTPDVFIAMPNHIHGILFIADAIETKPTTLGMVVGSYKAAVTREMRAAGFDGEVWHGRFYDHIIRTQEELERIRAYVIDNPRRWGEKYGGEV
jgi:REP element-mobilizing transposase RayT